MVPRLIARAALVAVVGAACAAGFVTATSASTASVQTCSAFGAVKTLHGHVSMTLHDVATGDAPGIAGSETVSLARHAANVAVQLKKAKVRVAPWSGFRGGAHGGSFVGTDTLSFTGGAGDTQTGTLTSKGGSRPLPALVFVTGKCRYTLVVTLGNTSTYSGDTGIASYSRSVGASFVTPNRQVPASLKLAGAATVIAEPSDGACQLTAGLGCATFSGGWADDYETLKECHSVVAANCSQGLATDFTDAKISWNISPG